MCEGLLPLPTPDDKNQPTVSANFSNASSLNNSSFFSRLALFSGSIFSNTCEGGQWGNAGEELKVGSHRPSPEKLGGSATWSFSSLSLFFFFCLSFPFPFSSSLSFCYPLSQKVEEKKERTNLHFLLIRQIGTRRGYSASHDLMYTYL